MSKKNEENFRDLIQDQNEAYDELLAQDIAQRESFAALERRMGHADDLLGPEPDFQEAQDHTGAKIHILSEN